MAAIAKKYLPGATGNLNVNGVAYNISDISLNLDPGLTECTNQNSLGWLEQVTTIFKLGFKFTVWGSTDLPVPAIMAGDVYPVIMKQYGNTLAQGNLIMGPVNHSTDLKGAVKYACDAMSQGPMTGSLVPADVIPTPPSGS